MLYLMNWLMGIALMLCVACADSDSMVFVGGAFICMIYFAIVTLVKERGRSGEVR